MAAAEAARRRGAGGTAASGRSPRLPPRPPQPREKAGGAPRCSAVVLAVLLGAAGLSAPPEFLRHLTVFLLACVVGWHVVWNVTPALHTPLMSVTNAISGIILVGGMLAARRRPGSAVIGAGRASPSCVASINVAGGFLVTQRMLRMFRK